MPVQRSAHAVYYLSFLEDQDSRNRPDSEPFGELGIFLGIDLHHNPLPRQITRHRLHHRCKVTAMRSPRGPEFHQDRTGELLRKGVEATVGKRHRLCIEGRQRRMAVAALPRPPLAGGGDPVGNPAGGAVDQISAVILCHGTPPVSRSRLIACLQGEWRRAHGKRSGGIL